MGILLAIILGVIVVGGGAYFVLQQQPPSQSSSEDNLDILQPLPTQPTSPSPTAGTANWKTYRSDKWGIEFKYPSNFFLNTASNELWVTQSPYRDGYDFFELIDTQNGCYIGPVLGVGLGGHFTQSNKSVSLSNELVKSTYSTYKSTSANRPTISSNCVKDFETILTTLKFTK
ncbi:MAG: hypothetical protein UY98_C0010G0006 [Candidatus Kaiserbacteria bacterium GW2011_GWA2_58_9]|uniref:Uncharacterized protein n=1 Tax=Candidatus Kaiserbacteria bacterium GW2011_GWA2_58_9 TaxID=1618672 RepID=A0A0G1YVL8_9BACT|nr:MAG: hypothetical protein UY98_C0010G0006 [Candidatus Kaiserbacteria bacterium GW2011_GWA2_58_9]